MNNLVALQLKGFRGGEALANGLNQNRLIKNQQRQLDMQEADRAREQEEIIKIKEGRFYGSVADTLANATSIEEGQDILNSARHVAENELGFDISNVPKEFASNIVAPMKQLAAAHGYKPKAQQGQTKLEKLFGLRDRLPEGDSRLAAVDAAIQKESTRGDGTQAAPEGFKLGKDQTRFDANGGEIARGVAGNQGAVANPNRQNTYGDSKSDIKVFEEDRKKTVQANVKRISELNKTKASRDASLRKARRFLRAFKFKDNDMLDTKAESGATRSFLNARLVGTDMSLFPGVFTDQGQFDEELDAFAEVAAREKLKAVGEIRPTDADVEGMKRSMFGIARDEKTNINLLEEFINAQLALDDELDDLLELKNTGRMDSFIAFERGRPQANLPEGVTEEDIQHTMQLHGVTREDVLQRLQQ